MGVYEERAKKLNTWWETTGKYLQQEYELSLPQKKRDRMSRNRNTHGGWVVPGIAGMTRVIKLSRVPWDYYWSGSNPTPSTQYPRVVSEHFYDVIGEANPYPGRGANHKTNNPGGKDENTCSESPRIRQSEQRGRRGL